MAAKIEIQKRPDGTVHGKVIGKIDEHFDARELLSAAREAKEVVLQLDGVRSTSSLGSSASSRCASRTPASSSAATPACGGGGSRSRRAMCMACCRRRASASCARIV